MLIVLKTNEKLLLIQIKVLFFSFRASEMDRERNAKITMDEDKYIQ